jgi:hypothetical protein
VNAIPRDPAKRALFHEIKRALGVGDTMARALAVSNDPDWQEQMIERYGDRLSALERDDLWRHRRGREVSRCDRLQQRHPSEAFGHSCFIRSAASRRITSL